MGRTSGKAGNVAEQTEMFVARDMGRQTNQTNFQFGAGQLPDSGVVKAPDQTDAKSRLISEYISKFQLITKGGLYIDGFSAPQSRPHEDAWTARRVLEIQPPRIRTFWLCDIDPAGLIQLRRLKDQHHQNPKTRRVFILEGDFNTSVKTILSSHRLTRKAAIFALLDQRNTECHWATVKALAARAGRTKIELLYFLGTSWIHRSITQSHRPERIAQIDKWWGDSDWRGLADLSQVQIVERVANRFTKELGYRFVTPYPIFQQEKGIKAAFHLIHASDHPEAPKLMSRAYLKLFGETPGVHGGRQREMFDE